MQRGGLWQVPSTMPLPGRPVLMLGVQPSGLAPSQRRPRTSPQPGLCTHSRQSTTAYAEACFLTSLPSNRELQGSEIVSHTEYTFNEISSWAICHDTHSRGMPGRRAKLRSIDTCLSLPKFSVLSLLLLLLSSSLASAPMTVRIPALS